jgi:diguanylate cyclase (GGDEF)-like protein
VTQSGELRQELLRSCATHIEAERTALPLLAGVLALAAVPSAGAALATAWFVGALLLCAGLHTLGRRLVNERVGEGGRVGFTFLRALQSALWGSLALLAWDAGDPKLQLAWLFLVCALLVVFCVSAAPLPRLALAQGLPLFAVALYLGSRQETLPLLPYVAGFGPALAMLVHPLRASAVRDAEARLALERAKREAEAANRELAELAATDELTRVPNRRAFLGRAAEEMADQHGHGTGDEILRVVADILADALRETDLLARFGGDEFALLLPETPASGARVLANRLREAVERAQVHAAGEPVQVTFSCGITTYEPGDKEVATLIERADRALYSAKRSGRNRIELHPDSEAAGAAD